MVAHDAQHIFTPPSSTEAISGIRQCIHMQRSRQQRLRHYDQHRNYKRGKPRGEELLHFGVNAPDHGADEWIPAR